MKDAIQKIIEEIPEGKVFDSHYVINQLIAGHSDVYLVFASELINSRKTTETQGVTAYVHSKISLKIGESDLAARVELDGKKTEFWSENIRGNASDCAGWRRK